MNTKTTKPAEVAAAVAPVAGDDVTSPTNVATVTTDAEQGDETLVEDAKGFTVRKAFAMKQFVPHPNWIIQNIVLPGAGTKAVIGRVFGIATATEDKTNTDNNGEVRHSIYVKGSFEAESYLTGEVFRSAGVFLPSAYAEQIKLALSDAAISSAEIDCDIGLEATGKTIAYAWTVTAFREGAEMDVLKRVRSTRAKPKNILTSATGEPLAIAAPAEKAALPAS